MKLSSIQAGVQLRSVGVPLASIGVPLASIGVPLASIAILKPGMLADCSLASGVSCPLYP